MRLRPSILLTPEDKAVCVKWTCRMLSIWAVIVIATLTLPVFRGESANVPLGQARDHAAVRSQFPSGSVDRFTNEPVAER